MAVFICVQSRVLHLILSYDYRRGIIIAVVIIISINSVIVHSRMQSLFYYKRSRAASIMYFAKVAVKCSRVTEFTEVSRTSKLSINKVT